MPVAILASFFYLSFLVFQMLVQIERLRLMRGIANSEKSRKTRISSMRRKIRNVCVKTHKSGAETPSMCRK